MSLRGRMRARLKSWSPSRRHCWCVALVVRSIRRETRGWPRLNRAKFAEALANVKPEVHAQLMRGKWHEQGG
jgi:hypothetical protein